MESFTSDHVVDTDLESDPSLYRIKMVGDKNKTIENLSKGYRMSISINMENYNVYIGSDHHNMQADANISARNLCAAYARYNREIKTFIVEDFSDWRNNVGHITGAKGAIEKALDRDLKPFLK